MSDTPVVTTSQTQTHEVVLRFVLPTWLVWSGSVVGKVGGWFGTVLSWGYGALKWAAPFVAYAALFFALAGQPTGCSWHWPHWPIPGPGPGPNPTPSPLPGEGLKVLFVYDPVNPPPKDQEEIKTDGAIAKYLESKCAKGPDGKTSEFRFLPKDTDISNESPTWQSVFKRGQKSLPWYIVSNGKKWEEGPWPANAQAMLAILQKYGG